MQQQGGRGGVLSLVGSSQSARRSFVPDKTLVLLESVHTDGASSEGRELNAFVLGHRRTDGTAPSKIQNLLFDIRWAMDKTSATRARDFRSICSEAVALCRSTGMNDTHSTTPLPSSTTPRPPPASSSHLRRRTRPPHVCRESRLMLGTWLTRSQRLVCEPGGRTLASPLARQEGLEPYGRAGVGLLCPIVGVGMRGI